MKKLMTKAPTYEFNIVCYNAYFSIWHNYKIVAKGRGTALRRAKLAFKNVLGVDPRESVTAQIISYKEI